MYDKAAIPKQKLKRKSQVNTRTKSIAQLILVVYTINRYVDLIDLIPSY